MYAAQLWTHARNISSKVLMLELALQLYDLSKA